MGNTKVDYFAALDLGHPQEFTALAVLERTTSRSDWRSAWSPSTYAAVHLERFPLGTSYPEMCCRLAVLFTKPPLARAPLDVDQSAVGTPVLDLLRRASIKARIRAVTITNGPKASLVDGVWQLPKICLVSTVQILLQARRLKVGLALPEAETLVQQLESFKMKVSLDAAAAPGWREGPQDDLVLALAIAAWAGEHNPPASRMVPHVIGCRTGYR
jgi:hypothetical protein